MKTNKTCLMIIVTSLFFILSTLTTLESFAEAKCDRACLEGFVDRYIDSMVKHDPSSVQLTDNVKFTENGVELKVVLVCYRDTQAACAG